MVPKIKSGEKCTYVPIQNPDDVRKGDMVYCHIGKYYFTHLVTAKKSSGKDTQFQISNNHGHVNGWCGIDRIFGKVTHVGDRTVRG